MPAAVAHGDLLSEYMTISAAARMLEQSEASIRRLVDLGRVRAIRDLNNHRLIVREDVTALARARKRGDGR
jgi:excisionase family DNA binding protein